MVHGAWHGGWCWEKVVPLLEAQGHSVIVPDLPSLGADSTPIADVTLPLWTQSIVTLVDAQTEPVILVGHSRGGVVISEVAERRPDMIRKLVYLTAFLLQDGQSLIELAQTDTQAVIGQYFEPSSDGLAMNIREDGIVPSFYHDCSADDSAAAKARLRPEPMVALVTPVNVTSAKFGRVPRIYIECLDDRAIGPATQHAMYTALPCESVVSLNTSHSPFYSAPEKLAAILAAV